MTNDRGKLLKYGQAVEYLPPRLRSEAMKISEDEKVLVEEFRLRGGQGFSVTIGGRERQLNIGSSVRHEELQTVLELATRSSVHAAQSSICEGFVTVVGGHRIGLCGTAIRNGGIINGVKELSSVSIRIAKDIRCADDEIMSAIVRKGRFINTLILSPPGFGKTTMLRDIIRRLSDSGIRISLVDERKEVAAKSKGIPQFDIGKHTDVLDGISKADGAMFMLRAMNPEIIAVDEITREEDVAAVFGISNCGVGILATAHGEGPESIFARPLYRKLYDLKIFKKAITLLKNEDVFSYKITEL